ncbi:MAG: isopentenyl-diphosphate delta-isomerase [Crocinitomicaceae bacterium]|nr:isopentenyl-diphosphate delta-isomerase [Crocinitomicaceae bacterium]
MTDKNLNKIAKQTESRKDSHLELALSSQNEQIDTRFYYEPMMAAHPSDVEEWPVQIGTKILRFPIWISSMTGGTKKTNEINMRLANTAAKHGLGIGLGSSRIALENDKKINDFDIRPIIGRQLPFYLNFGIAQIEKMLEEKSTQSIVDLVGRLDADGVIIHVNPLQEWMQPEGDRIKKTPIETIQLFLKATQLSVIVKEVGQGFGYKSMKELMQLPLTAIEFAANGGTNFSKLELMRNQSKSEFLMPFVQVGHSAEEMVLLNNSLIQELGNKVQCKTVIISGGIKNCLDGYYLLQSSKANAVYGQASEFLKHAKVSQEALDEFTKRQIEGLLLARTYLTLKQQ